MIKMLEYIGKYNKCKILIDNVEENVVTQMYSMMNNPAFNDSNIVVMPDCHIGSGVVVGFTMSMNDYIVPSVVGVDIGCGISAYNLGKVKEKCEKLDNFIKSNIPSGSEIREKSIVEPVELNDVIKRMDLDGGYMFKSLGSMGGGNHFCELDKDEQGNVWFVVHSGSRNFGLQVAKFHQSIGKQRMKEIYGGGAYNGLEYLMISEDTGKQYINDIQIAQRYAALNRELIAKIVIEKFYKLQFRKIDKIESIHNYINLQDRIVRKGAISAKV
jgi:RNA-splicing ligase RtcB